MATDPKPATAARKRAAKKNDPSRVTALIDAAKFASMAQRGGGDSAAQKHCVINNKMIIACDGVLTVGMPIEEEFTACPNTALFMKAMHACGENFTLTMIDPTTMQVQSGRFRAKVHCLLPRDMPSQLPDPLAYPCGQPLVNAIKEVSVLATEGSPTIARAAILIDKGCAVGFNGTSMLQAYHGQDLPPAIIVPKSFANAIAKVPVDVKGFGYSVGSFTLHFVNGAFVKCQRFMEGWPDPSIVLDRYPGQQFVEVPTGLTDAIATCAPFSENGDVYLHGDSSVVSSGPRGSGDAAESIEGIPAGLSVGLHSGSVALCAKHMLKWNVTDSDRGVVYFVGNMVRGAIVGIKDT